MGPLTPATYKKHADGANIDLSLPVLFTKPSGEKVLKILEVSPNDHKVRWAEPADMSYNEEMLQGYDYM